MHARNHAQPMSHMHCLASACNNTVILLVHCYFTGNPASLPGTSSGTAWSACSTDLLMAPVTAAAAVPGMTGTSHRVVMVQTLCSCAAAQRSPGWGSMQAAAGEAKTYVSTHDAACPVGWGTLLGITMTCWGGLMALQPIAAHCRTTVTFLFFVVL